jgi:drug/metabolite transporter (DMT)-like permease
MRNATVLGAVFGSITGLAWGGQFVIGASALHRVDAFPLTTLRYALAGALLLGLLALREGRGALRLEGHGLRLFGLGTLGFAGFNLLAYTGLAHARPQSASLIVALAPLVTALVLWQRTRIRPSPSTFGFLAVALTGVALVISGGHPTTIVTGSIGWGDGLVLAGVVSFVIYGLGAARTPEFSPLRYTALTASLGWLSIAAATVVGIAAGFVTRPSAADVWAVSPHLLYLAIPGAVIGVLTWNASIRLIGPQNAVLFGNLIPVTTFAIEIARGYRPNAVELGGAALTVAALITSNLVARRRLAPAAAQSISVERDGLAEAA